jgi:hypothetical protein
VDVVDVVDVVDAVDEGGVMVDTGAVAAAVAVAGSVDGWDGLDFDGLSAEERIDALVACERLARRAQALVVRALGVLDRAQQRERGVERGCTEAEVCAALRWAPNTAQTRLAEAGMLTSRFPETLDSLSHG